MSSCSFLLTNTLLTKHIVEDENISETYPVWSASLFLVSEAVLSFPHTPMTASLAIKFVGLLSFKIQRAWLPTARGSTTETLKLAPCLSALWPRGRVFPKRCVSSFLIVVWKLSCSKGGIHPGQRVMIEFTGTLQKRLKLLIIFYYCHREIAISNLLLRKTMKAKNDGRQPLTMYG